MAVLRSEVVPVQVARDSLARMAPWTSAVRKRGFQAHDHPLRMMCNAARGPIIAS
jgi:hypothetical protein